MATKKEQEQQDNAMMLAVIPAVLISVVFTLYYFRKLKAQYVTGPQTRRVFDAGAQARAFLISGILGFFVYVFAIMLNALTPWTLVLTIPLCFFLLRWIGKVQAYAFLTIDGEGRMPVDAFDGIVSRFEAESLRPPVLQFTGERTWQASCEWDEPALMPREKVGAEVQRWARDTAIRVAEHWLLLAGVLGVSQEPRQREASNEKRF